MPAPLSTLDGRAQQTIFYTFDHRPEYTFASKWDRARIVAFEILCVTLYCLDFLSDLVVAILLLKCHQSATVTSSNGSSADDDGLLTLAVGIILSLVVLCVSNAVVWVMNAPNDEHRSSDDSRLSLKLLVRCAGFTLLGPLIPLCNWMVMGGRLPPTRDVSPHRRSCSGQKTVSPQETVEGKDVDGQPSGEAGVHLVSKVPFVEEELLQLMPAAKEANLRSQLCDMRLQGHAFFLIQSFIETLPQLVLQILALSTVYSSKMNNSGGKNSVTSSTTSGASFFSEDDSSSYSSVSSSHDNDGNSMYPQQLLLSLEIVLVISIIISILNLLCKIHWLQYLFNTSKGTILWRASLVLIDVFSTLFTVSCLIHTHHNGGGDGENDGGDSNARNARPVNFFNDQWKMDYLSGIWLVIFLTKVAIASVLAFLSAIALAIFTCLENKPGTCLSVLALPLSFVGLFFPAIVLLEMTKLSYVNFFLLKLETHCGIQLRGSEFHTKMHQIIYSFIFSAGDRDGGGHESASSASVFERRWKLMWAHLMHGNEGSEDDDDRGFPSSSFSIYRPEELHYRRPFLRQGVLGVNNKTRRSVILSSSSDKTNRHRIPEDLLDSRFSVSGPCLDELLTAHGQPTGQTTSPKMTRTEYQEVRRSSGVDADGNSETCALLVNSAEEEEDAGGIPVAPFSPTRVAWFYLRDAMSLEYHGLFSGKNLKWKVSFLYLPATCIELFGVLWPLFWILSRLFLSTTSSSVSVTLTMMTPLQVALLVGYLSSLCLCGGTSPAMVRWFQFFLPFRWSNRIKTKSSWDGRSRFPGQNLVNALSRAIIELYLPSWGTGRVAADILSSEVRGRKREAKQDSGEVIPSRLLPYELKELTGKFMTDNEDLVFKATRKDLKFVHSRQ